MFFLFTTFFLVVHAIQQQPFTTSRTLVNALSDDPDFSSILSLFQRARLIPTLNKLNGSTLFAPTNEAIERHLLSNELWRLVLYDESFVVTDNVQYKLRQQLFYHLLNVSVTAFPTDPPRVLVAETLHFPTLGPPPKDPPSDPWFPIPGGSLGGAPQRLRFTARDETVWVGVDASGQGGAEVVKGQVDAGNGILLGINAVLQPPPELAEVITNHGPLSYFQQILTPEIVQVLNTTSEMTVFIPVNDAWKALDPYERLYLESEFATDDLRRILNMHAVVTDSVKWSDTFGMAVNLTTVDGSNLEIIVSPEKTTISSATLIEPDIYAANGVLHLVSSLLIPEGALRITPEKYLLALNCTQFVSLLHSTDLTYLVNATEPKFTILAPSDDVLSVLGDKDLPERGSEELRRLLQYHFLPGHFTKKKLQDGMLLDTALEEKGLGGGPQVLSVQVDPKTSETISFGGASIIGEPIQVDNTLIYFVSRPLIPPSDHLQTALPFLDLSIFVAAIYSVSLADKLKDTPSTTLLIPHNTAFKRLGMLVSEHLMSASSKDDLERVILHHTLIGVEYARSLRNGSQHTFPTLEGTDLHLERTSNNSLIISASGGWAEMQAQLYPKDVLTETGVIHELSDLLIPRTVELTIGKLVKAAKGNTMTTLVTKAGMDWVLNGTAPPEGSPWDDAGLHGAAWTLLCPRDDAFKAFNLTELYANVAWLREIVAQHLVPTPPYKSIVDDYPVNNNRPLVMDDSAAYTTLRSPSSVYGDVVFRKSEDKEDTYVVGIKGARGTDGQKDWAKVLSWGRSTSGSGVGGVIQIDRVLVPYQPPWWIEYGVPFVFGGIATAGLCVFFYAANVFWRRDTTEATYEPVGGFDRTDDDA